MRGLKTGFILFISLWFAVSCSKEEGKGGLASINGVVMVQNVNYHTGQKFGTLQPAQDERVYILYGSNTTAIGNDTRTSFDGSFAFPFLVQGNYSIFALSDDIANVNGTLVEVKQEISLNSKKAKVEADTIMLYRFVKYNKGSSSIRGKVVRNYGGNPPHGINEGDDDYDTNIVQDVEVYLVMNGSSEILDRIRTDENGEFKFPNLIPATYRVYVYEDGAPNYNPKDVVGCTKKITGDNQHITLETFRINKK